MKRWKKEIKRKIKKLEDITVRFLQRFEYVASTDPDPYISKNVKQFYRDLWKEIKNENT